ncbi:hypothetical protein Q5752_005768 [Cryptotrichosporon argae]
MSNQPDELSDDPQPQMMPAEMVAHRAGMGTLADGPAVPAESEPAVKAHGADQRKVDDSASVSRNEKALSAVASDSDGDGKEAGGDGDESTRTYVAGGKLRELNGQVPEFPGLRREKFWQLWRPKHAPPPPPKSLDDATEIPLATTNIVSRLTFHWVTPIMSLGYQRPLQATDLWKLDPSRESDLLSNKFIEALNKRQAAAREWNAQLDTVSVPKRRRAQWALYAALSGSLPADYAQFGPAATYGDRRRTFENEWRQRSGKKKGSVTWALNDSLTGFWSGGIFKVFSDEAQLMSPLVIKVLINFSKEVIAAKQNGTPSPNIGRGVAAALGLFCLTIMQSICQHQFFFRSMAIGVLARASLISATYKRSFQLTVGARAQHPNGKMMSHLSSDISRIDYCAQWFHAIWTAPIQLIVTLILLLVQIGPSALVGFALFILLAPLQTWFMKFSFIVRKKSMKWTDGRSKLLQELLSSMQIIKVFTYEIPFLKRLAFIRGKEMLGVRKILIIRAANQALAFSIPILASVLAFVTYASTHPNMDPALIFTALAYFNLLRQPLMFLPRALSTLTDAQNAIERLTEVFEADIMEPSDPIDPNLDVAIRAKNATFVWAAARVDEEVGAGKGGKGKGGKGRPGSKKDDAKKQAGQAEPKPDGPPFAIENINFEVPRGRLVAIVGAVGSGKSSLLQGMLGEMHTTRGSVEFGGRLGYCQQSAWIQNTTLRENVLFGRPWDEHRYWEVIKAASLVTDLEILPDGDLTEIGEKGVNLSGGQKQRINIARALYNNADIILFDDPLSAVDAHVGKALFADAIRWLKQQGKTVILVTHALHFLPQVDYIYTLNAGKIVEEGSYTTLMQSGGPFSRLITEFGGQSEAKKETEDADAEAALEEAAVDNEKPATDEQKITQLTAKLMGKAAGTGKLEGRLMVSETRKTGSVGRRVYGKYLKAGQAWFTLPMAIACAAIFQTSQVLATVWLTWWEADHFNRSQGFYEGIYAVLGVSSAVFTFAMGASMGIMSYLASRNLYRAALHRVFYSPMAFFDTQPLGRIMGIFGKDIDTVDNQLADAFRMQAITLINLLGSIIIISVYFNYFIAIIFVVGIGYWYFALYYRTSARELKRLDSMLRSLLYSHYSESLSGLATIRAYGETARFIRENGYYMDLEDRAYLLTATNQRWLSVRLDFMGALLVFAVAIMCANGGGGLSASEIALCLTYMTSITQVLGMRIMNAVERILYYSDGSLPQEPSHDEGEVMPAPAWPEHGKIQFDNVVMSYREGLPPVLKSISFDIAAGERVGIIGRTGAGKTSITVALYRLAEISSGAIRIDGVDVAQLALRDLRSKIAIIPQDPVLFSGTLRSNLDPFDLHDDAALHDAMQRACLLDDGSALSPGPGAGEGLGAGARATASAPSGKRLTLDSAIEDEGANLSVGERSLVSLARALVKDSRIVVLDEATAAVDLETDAKIQETIRNEFRGKTLLCIAHRLRTIISWDKILVMNAGQVEDFDTPLALFDQGGLFRTMCERSSISRDDIVRARQSERDDV